MQEIVRKSGLAIQPEEDVLRVNLDKIMKQLNNPMQYKVRLVMLNILAINIYVKNNLPAS